MKNQTIGTALATSVLLLAFAGQAAASTLQSTIAAAEQAFGGEAFSAGKLGAFSEVEVLSNNQLIETLYSNASGELVDSEAYGSPRRVDRVQTSLDSAQISLSDAITIAEDAVGPGEVLDAELQVSRNSTRNGRFLIDIRTDAGVLDVIVDAVTGRVLRIIRD